MSSLLMLYYNIKLKHLGIHISKYFVRMKTGIYDIYNYNKKENYFVIGEDNKLYYWRPDYKYPDYIELIDMEDDY